MLSICVRRLALAFSSSSCVFVLSSSLAPTILQQRSPGEASAELPSVARDEIRAAHQFASHVARRVEGGFEVRNAGQGWSTRFDENGSLTKSDRHGWSWGLALESFGFADAKNEVTRPERLVADGQRVTLDWGQGLEEWYINDERGLEHGFTVGERPSSPFASNENHWLQFTLEVRGDLEPRIVDEGRGVQFTNRDQQSAVNYLGLVAFDAEGHELDAGFTCRDGKLLLTVDEQGARYPLTIDPIAQDAYFKASNSDAYDIFGTSVAISGNTVVVGAPGEASSATGVNGNQSNNSAAEAGAAYVFVHDGSSWTQEAYLKASNTDGGDRFGQAVAIDGDTIIVSAVKEDSGASGIDGDQNDNGAGDSGAVYVFARSGSTWSQEAYIKASNTDAGDQFGWAVSLSGDTLAVGTLEEESNATGVNGAQGDNSLTQAGAAYVFTRSGSTWSQEAYIKASNTGAGDQFGICLAVLGDRLAVGAQFEASLASGVGGDQNDNSAPKSGAVYVYDRVGQMWSQSAYIKPSNMDQGDWFGAALDLSPDWLVVGATYEDSSDPTVNGDEDDDSFPSAGAAYVFTFNGSTWVQEAYLKASNAGDRDHYGFSISISGNRVAVGAADEDSSGHGIDGDQIDNSSLSSGAVYIYEFENSTWSQIAYFKAQSSGEFDNFGGASAFEGDTLIVGAWGEDSSSNGLAGNPFDNSSSFAGAAYLFDFNAPAEPGSAFCFGDGTGAACPCVNFGALGEGCSNSTGSGALLTGAGDPLVSADTFTLAATGSVPNSTGLLLQGTIALGGGDGNPVGNGRLCVNPQKRWMPRVADSNGFVSYGPALLGSDPAATRGTTLLYQWWYRDQTHSCVSNFNFSNAWSVTWF